MNPKAHPVIPHTSKGLERDLTRFLLIYQAAVEVDPENNPYATRDRTIPPMRSDYAAEITGRTRGYMQNTLSPFNNTNPPGLKEFYRLLHSGLDISVVAELLRPRRAVVFELPPESETEADPRQLALHLAELGKEVGDVFAKWTEVLKEDSDGGRQITLSEKEGFERECLEVIPKLLMLIEDMRRHG